jgi:hypothetical protein
VAGSLSQNVLVNSFGPVASSSSSRSAFHASSSRRSSSSSKDYEQESFEDYDLELQGRKRKADFKLRKKVRVPLVRSVTISIGGARLRVWFTCTDRQSGYVSNVTVTVRGGE